MPTPESNVSVTFQLKNGTSLLYNNVKFFPQAGHLLFNVDNSSVIINENDIELISILGKSYVIRRVESTDKGCLQIWLKSI